MDSFAPVATGDLLARTGMPVDVMTFWLRKGLLRAIDATRVAGQHRRFMFYEVNLAAVLLQVREFRTNIDGLFSVAAIYHEAIDWGAELGVSRDDVFAMWTVFTQRAFRDRGDYADEAEYQASLDPFRHERHGAKRVTPRIEALATQTGKLTFRQHLNAFLSIMDQPPPRNGENPLHPDVSYFWRAGDRWRLEVGENGPLTARRDGAMATIAIDVPEVIYRVWNRP